MTAVYAGGAEIAEVVRSGFVEGRHRGSVAVVDASGALVASAGDPHGAIFPRSANKPMQAVAMLRSGLRLPDPADLAIVCASHSGEPMHVERVRGLLSAGDLSESDLRCPPAYPLSEVAAARMRSEGLEPTREAMNCSGKHAGMLRTCVAAGWPIGDYVAPDHPLQKACRTAIEDLCDEGVGAIGVDGCGAPVMAVSLTGLAGAFLRLVSAPAGTPERAVADAMRAHPQLVAGTDREDLRLMRGVPGLLAKGGAEGVLAVAVAGAGAVAVKIDDGGARACVPVLVAALAQLGVGAACLDEMAQAPVLGGGAPVGCIRDVTLW